MYYKKAKYPKVGNEYGGPNAKPQGYGSAYGGNHQSTVINNNSSKNISENHDSDWA